MTCKHNWTFVNGLTKRIRCTRCAALQSVDRDQYTDIVSNGALVPRNVFDAASQPEQEPVVWGVDWGKEGDIPCVSIIKRLPDGSMKVVAVEYAPQRPWIGLTDEEMHDCGDSPLTPLGMKHVRMIEAKLKEKNGFATPAQGWRKRQIEEMKE